MQDVARVVLALEAPDVAEEVMHFLDRSGRARVVATASDDRQLVEAVRQLEPDAVVAQPSLVGAPIANAALLALDTRESVSVLRAAIGAGADGFFVWPGERERLVDVAARTMARRRSDEPRGSVIAVHGSRGGAGATFVSSELSAAVVRASRSCVVVDGDLTFGDLGAALGAPGEDVPTLAELSPLGEEISYAHVQDASWAHAAGFGVMLAPPVDGLGSIDHAVVPRVVDAAASGLEAVVVDLPRALTPAALDLLRAADHVLEVLTLDVLSFRAAARTLDVLGAQGTVSFVVNRASRGEVTAADVRRAFGAEPLAVIPADAAVGKAQDHGRLVARGRIGRAFDRLAVRLLDTGEEAIAS